MTGKVLGIGLSRTGTLSLAQALRTLGYRTAHFRDHRETRRGLATWLAGDFAADELAGHDAAVDLPVPAFYRELDRRYPGSKFILTVRGAEPWLDSVRRHWERTPITADAAGDYRRRVRLAMYGSAGFEAAAMRAVLERHQREVRAYFASRPDDLLELDVCGGQGWAPLCAFLDRPMPPEPFPWAHRG